MSRMDKINEEIRHQVGIILQRDIHDSRIGFVTITHVDTAPDLRTCKVYFTTLDEGDTYKETIAGLNASSSNVRRELGKRIRIKYTPNIEFIHDAKDSESNRIDQIIDIIHKDKEDK